MKAKTHPRRFVLCVRNDGYEASLELRKVYRRLPDAKAKSHDLIRVVDESGEDYLYPQDFFVPINVPQAGQPVFAEVS